MLNIKGPISILALAASVLLSGVVHAGPPVGTSVKIQSVGYDYESNRIFQPTVLDLGTKYVYTRESSSKDWKLVSAGGDFYNIKSTSRPDGCIYDSSGSSLAKFDRSCNSNYPRAEWEFTEIKSGQYKITNGLGRCLQVDNNRNRLKAVSCVSDTTLYQLFTVN